MLRPVAITLAVCSALTLLVAVPAPMGGNGFRTVFPGAVSTAHAAERAASPSPTSPARSMASKEGAGKEGRYVAGIEDLPLMNGLTAVESETLVFDKPAGRIVQAVARGRVTAGTARAFYAKTLPQLGWRETAPNRFQREDETLLLEYEEAATSGAASGGSANRGGGGVLTLRFTLSPK